MASGASCTAFPLPHRPFPGNRYLQHPTIRQLDTKRHVLYTRLTLPQPDGPRGVGRLVVYVKLTLQDVVPLVVDLLPVGDTVVLVLVHWSELAVPDWHLSGSVSASLRSHVRDDRID